MVNIIQWIKWVIKLFLSDKGHVPESSPTGYVISSQQTLVKIPDLSEPTGIWQPCKPFDIQWGGSFDEDNCDVMGALEALEPLLKKLINHPDTPQILSDELKKAGFVNELGDVKLSARFTSVMSGVKQGIGVSMLDVWNSINRDGVIPYSLWPDPAPGFTWNEYMKPIDPEIIAIGKRISAILTFPWKWVNQGVCNPDLNTVKKALIQAPLHLCGPVCPKDSSDIEQPCGTCQCRHCRTIMSMNEYINLLDHYGQDKLTQTALNCQMPFIIQPSIQII